MCSAKVVLVSLFSHRIMCVVLAWDGIIGLTCFMSFLVDCSPDTNALMRKILRFFPNHDVGFC